MWRVYYDDGAVLVGDQDSEIPDDRRHGVISVAESDPTHNWGFWFGKDWYLLLRSGCWMGVDDHGLIDQICSRLDTIKYVLQGRTLTPFSAYQSAIDRMMRECRPRKTGWHPGERT